jgi:quercetin dioxygenase-like cupin family protein
VSLRRIRKESLAMPFVELNQFEPREIFPGFKAHFVHSTNMTFAHWTIKAGATLPEHAHVHEQVVNMIEGEFELTIAGKIRRLGRGSVAIIPSNALHSGKAITDCRIIDAFYPIREDYR